MATPHHSEAPHLTVTEPDTNPLLIYIEPPQETRHALNLHTPQPSPTHTALSHTHPSPTHTHLSHINPYLTPSYLSPAASNHPSPVHHSHQSHAQTRAAINPLISLTDTIIGRASHERVLSHHLPQALAVPDATADNPRGIASPTDLDTTLLPGLVTPTPPVISPPQQPSSSRNNISSAQDLLQLGSHHDQRDTTRDLATPTPADPPLPSIFISSRCRLTSENLPEMADLERSSSEGSEVSEGSEGNELSSLHGQTSGLFLSLWFSKYQIYYLSFF